MSKDMHLIDKPIVEVNDDILGEIYGLFLSYSIMRIVYQTGQISN